MTQKTQPAPSTTTEPARSSHPNKPTHDSATGRLLELFKRLSWVCGEEMWKVAGFRYTGRLHDLRQMGYRFERRTCEHPFHNHERSHMYQWSMTGVPGRLFR